MQTKETTQNSAEISGTIYGSYDYSFEGKGAWVGHAILAIGGRQSVKATFIDRNKSIVRKKDGAICGTETITLSFPDGGTFDIAAEFTGTPGGTPGLYTLNESGSIANGTGTYRSASGHVVVQGPFLVPDPATTPGAPPWIAEIHGFLQGSVGKADEERK